MFVHDWTGVSRLLPVGLLTRHAIRYFEESWTPDFAGYALNSLMLSVSAAVLTLIIGVLLAYAKGAADPERLAELRGRMQVELAGERAGRYHPKLGFGGLVDVELATQWLQMHERESGVRERHTLDALDGLRRAEVAPREHLDALRRGYTFFRRVEQALQLLDPSASQLHFGGPRWEAITRRLGVRARDGVDAEAVLQRDWHRVAEANRRAFESLVAPVSQPAPWQEAP